ncbi:MAG: hypothetical protein JWO19_3851 [Bryobacterales bacterium]|jgi:hypothetical protein|nr:hypothetical protein [Bryobacterales bacterium]
MADDVKPLVTEHETTDAPIRAIVFSAIALSVTAALVLAVSVGVFRYFVAHRAEVPPNTLVSGDRLVPPAPRVEEHPAIELQTLRQQEDQILSSYGWIDRTAGIIRIPIDRAIDLQLERGFPTRTEKQSR